MDRGVVGRRAGERLARERLPRRVRERPLRAAQLGEHRGVVAGIDDHADPRLVLGGRADHRRPADVDLLDRLGQARLGLRDRRLERIQIHRDQIDRRDAVGFDVALVARVVAAREQAAVHARVQRLHPAAQHLRAPGELRDVDDGQARRAQRLGGAARGDQLEAELGQARANVDETRLVGDGEQRAPLGTLRGAGGHRIFSPHAGSRKQSRE